MFFSYRMKGANRFTETKKARFPASLAIKNAQNKPNYKNTYFFKRLSIT